MKNNAAIVRSLSFTFTVFPLGQPGVKMFAARGDASELRGWYAPAPGMKIPASVLKLDWESPSLPWVGGYLVIPGTEVNFHAEETDPDSGTVTFCLGERKFRLSARPSSTPPETAHEI